MYCLLCGKSYPDTQIICSPCNNNMQRIKPYSPHLSQIIRIGEAICTGENLPQNLEIAVETLLDRLDDAEDVYFEEESKYSEEDKIILEEHLNSILENADFLRKSLEELLSAAKMMDTRSIYTVLDKAKIAETMLLKSSAKLGNLTEEEIEVIAKEKGIQLKKN